MGRILAPSNTGWISQEMKVPGWYRVKTPWPNRTDTLDSPKILHSYKSVTQRSDGVSPTNYTRMISKLVSMGAWDAESALYFVHKDQSHISLAAYPNGCDITAGKVTVPGWMTDKVIRDASADMHQLNANILEDLGQLKQTGDLIADLVKLIYELFVNCLKGNFRNVRRWLRQVGSNVPKSIANGWLMYFYGIKPLVSTIDALASRAEPLFKTLKVRKRSKISVDPLAYVSGTSGYIASGTAFVQAQCELRAQVKLDSNTRSWANLGLTSSIWSDAVVTAWALVPYSFVFDWFIPVEAWLRSLVWSPTLIYQGGYVGKRHIVDAKVTDTLTSWGPGYYGTFPTSRLSVLFYRREVHPYVVPPADLNIRLSLTSTQIISASALITARS